MRVSGTAEALIVETHASTEDSKRHRQRIRPVLILGKQTISWLRKN